MNAAAAAAIADPPPDVRLMDRLATLLVVATVAVLAGGGVAALMRAPMFHIDSVRIEGDVVRNNAATIRTAVMPRLQGSFFTLDLAATKRAFQSVPWVRSASVRRVWPNRLVVRLEEHRVAALWQGADGHDRLVNVQGEVFDANLGDVEDDALPVLAGPDGSAARVLGMHGRLAAVFAALPARIEKLELSGRGSWQVELDSGAKVQIGRGPDDEVLERAGRFVRTVPQLTAQYERPFVSADLRHRDGYAVRLRNVTTGTVPAADNRKR